MSDKQLISMRLPLSMVDRIKDELLGDASDEQTLTDWVRMAIAMRLHAQDQLLKVGPTSRTPDHYFEGDCL